MRIISWNVYYGTLNNNFVSNQTLNMQNVSLVSPTDRVRYILLLAAYYNVDVVVLQELPGALPPLLNGGVQGPGQITFNHNIGINNTIQVNFNYATIREQLVPPGYANLSASNRNYGVFINANIQNLQWAQPPTYYLPLTYIAYLKVLARPPIHFAVAKNNTLYNLFTWHNEIAPNAIPCLGQFANNLQQNGPVQRPVLAGDLNVYIQSIHQFFNNNWTDCYDGLDHILYYGNAQHVPGLVHELNFRSDAHYPVSSEF